VIFKLGELFCGAGGLGLGALQAKVHTNGTDYSIASVWANDYDEDACETYRNNICKDQPDIVIHKSVNDLKMDTLEAIDGLAFGFPCNDFSALGEKKGTNGTYGPLYSYGIEALKHFRPKWFLAENVSGLRHANEGKDLKMILDAMYEAGYDIYPHLYKFEEYGVPQSRHRIIIVGLEEDLNLNFKIPAPTVVVPITCREAIENPPIPKDVPNQELTAQDETVVARLKHIKPGQNAFTADIPPELQLKILGAKISQIYKRLDPGKPSYTITGSGGGGTHVYHWKENRALTNRERARLQSFPDTFVFHGSKESVRRQVGMAVPPVAAKVLFEAILKTFAGVQYESVQPSIAPMIHVKGTLERFSRGRQSSDNSLTGRTKQLISLTPGVE
jgi:DNA (cytosine-5)-methyltransferase 1